MKASLLFHEKKLISHKKSNKFAIVELKVWQIPKDIHYPEGLKYSLYLVHDGNIIVGFDNHKPKGHHLHIHSKEEKYIFKTYEKLLDDFWDLVKKKGYSI